MYLSVLLSVNATVDVAKIIKNAASSPLGIFALAIIILGVLAYRFFRNAPLQARLAIFLILLVGVASLAREVSLATATELESSEYRSDIARANEAFERGQLSAAAEFYGQAESAYQRGWEAHIGLGTVAYQQGNFVDALQHYGSALTLHSNDPSILNNLAMTEEALRDYDAAIKTLSRAISATSEGSPFRTDLLYDRGRLRLLMWLQSEEAKSDSNYRGAVEDFRQFLDRHGSPTYFALYHQACIAAATPGGQQSQQTEALRLLDACFSHVLSDSGDRGRTHQAIMRHLLTPGVSAKPDRVGNPVGCPPLIRAAQAQSGGLDRWLLRLDQR